MKVISYSLWGDNPIYTTGALKNADIAKTLYPDWECWYYTGGSCPTNVIELLETKDNVRIIPMSEEGDWTGMFWRFLPACNDNVSVMISRDTDSRLSEREKLAVDQWLASDKQFHIMRDHPYHNTVILGGMWGCKYPLLSDMDKLIDAYQKGNFWQVDQNFLREIVYNKVKHTCMVHDEFFEKQPFPTKRDNKLFVGMAFDTQDEPLHPEHGDLVICA